MINKEEVADALELYELFNQLPVFEQLLLKGYIAGRVNKLSNTIQQIEINSITEQQQKNGIELR